ncbi:MAG: SAM-dependent methyltransferase [Candidatus Brocadiia bacterium]|nr:hypothetical protein [Planctomycetota bacterium]
MTETDYVGRGGDKLEFALNKLDLDVSGATAADFGCNIGGFTDCLLQRGAQRVYAVDTGYGMFEWKLRNDDRVIVMERTNAMHVSLPEPMDIITADVGWTRQRHILPNALRRISNDGFILSLFKPQYEAEDALIHGGVVPPDDFDLVLRRSLAELAEMGIRVRHIVQLPRQKESKNLEAWLHILPKDCRHQNGDASSSED